MTGHDDPKDVLRRYLRGAGEALLWKAEGLSEYDVRRPLAPTGTSLLGLVKHVAGVEAEYLGVVFGRPFEEDLPWLGEAAEPDADKWVCAGESREEIASLYHRVWEHSDATIDMFDLESVGRVPWWPTERAEVTLHDVLVHLIAETNRHAGHADILRENLDGRIGLANGKGTNVSADPARWETYRAAIEGEARRASRL